MRKPNILSFKHISSAAQAEELGLEEICEDLEEDRRLTKTLGLIALSGGVLITANVLRGSGEYVANIFDAAIAAGSLAFAQMVPEQLHMIDEQLNALHEDTPLDIAA